MPRQQPPENRFEQLGDHEQPTEPMSQIISSPFSLPTLDPESSIDQKGVPAPQLDERPFPKQSANPVDAFNRQPTTPPIYPVLPPATPESRNGRPPGGTLPYIHPRKPGKSVASQLRRSLIPAFVRLFFVVVELLLLLRIVFQLFRLLNSSDNNVWAGLVYTTSALFVLPFRLLLENVKIPILYGTELYNYLLIVFALLMYVLISRILVRFLKAVLNSR